MTIGTCSGYHLATVQAMHASTITFPSFPSDRHGRVQTEHQLHTACHRYEVAVQRMEEGLQACETASQICETPKQACKTVAKCCKTQEKSSKTLWQRCIAGIQAFIRVQTCQTEKQACKTTLQVCETPKTAFYALLQICETVSQICETVSQICKAFRRDRKAHSKHDETPLQANVHKALRNPKARARAPTPSLATNGRPAVRPLFSTTSNTFNQTVSSHIL
jgi:hypothetical protein